MTDKKCEKDNPKRASKPKSKEKEKKKKTEQTKDKKGVNTNHLITEYFSRSTKRIPSRLLALYQENLIIYYISNNCDPNCEYAGDLIDVKEAKVSTKCKIKKKIMLTV